MAFELFSDVILTTDFPEHGLRAGDVGTIVDRHEVSCKETGYSADFFDNNGRTVTVVAIPASGLCLEGG